MNINARDLSIATGGDSARRPMRILALSSPSGGKCGIGDYNAELCAALRAQGHQVDLLPLVRCGDRSPMVREFQRRIANYDAAILQYDGSLYGDAPAEMFGNFAAVARSVGRRPAIAILHERLIPVARRLLVKPWSRACWPTWRSYIARRGMINAINSNLTVFVHGEHMRQEFISIGIAPERIEAIIYPLQPGMHLVEPRHLSETSTVKLIMFGFVTEYKGYEIVLNAMRILPENYVLTIAGGCVPFFQNDRTLDAIHGFIQTGQWPYHMEFGQIATVQRPYSDAERQSMERRVKFTGHVHPEQLAHIMSDADIALAPYRRSSGSAALADYVEFARPTIAAALPPFCDFAAHANCIRFVAIDAPFELAYAIRRLAMDIDERRRMFEVAKTFAQTHNFVALAQYCVSILSAAQPSPASVGAAHGGHPPEPTDCRADV
jgi:glycosyltransferase involved in cell wall biosynthesis